MPHPYTYLGVDRPWLVYTGLCTMEIEGHKAVEPHLYLSEECVQLVSSMSNPGAGRWCLLVRVCVCVCVTLCFQEFLHAGGLSTPQK